MERFGFENLEVYQRALRLSITLCKLANTFPLKYSRLRDQLIGAAISIPLNIAEGYGRGGAKEKVNFYRMAKASAFECIPILSVARSLELLTAGRHEYFRGETQEVTKMLSGLISSKSP